MPRRSEEKTSQASYRIKRGAPAHVARVRLLSQRAACRAFREMPTRRCRYERSRGLRAPSVPYAPRHVRERVYMRQASSRERSPCRCAS